MRESQYIDSYLAANARRGRNKGITPGTYITYVLSGRAKQYSGRYLSALRNACERRVDAGVVLDGYSKMGKTAYYPAKVA